MTCFLIATRNAHKVGEIRAILGDEFGYLSMKDFNAAPDVVEDARTFAGNATKKAVEIAKWISGSPRLLDQTGSSKKEFFVLADDSGLEVDALGGAPGVHSARFAALDTGQAGNSSTEANNIKLLRLLKGVPAEKRTGRFKCALALTPVLLTQPSGASPVCAADEFEFQTRIFEGSCEGSIGFEPKGAGGFGYDPLFFPSGYQQSFAEMSEEMKNELSHRSKALRLLKQLLMREASGGNPKPEVE